MLLLQNPEVTSTFLLLIFERQQLEGWRSSKWNFDIQYLENIKHQNGKSSSLKGILRSVFGRKQLGCLKACVVLCWHSLYYPLICMYYALIFTWDNQVSSPVTLWLRKIFPSTLNRKSNPSFFGFEVFAECFRVLVATHCIQNFKYR